MPNIARTTPRPAARASVPAAKTKILLVRQPVKSVRQSDEPNRAAIRLAYAITSGVGFLALLWLMGFLGFRLGFAQVVRVPDLLVENAGGFAAGVLMFISLPQTIIEAGIAQPIWLMIGFAMIAVPAAILGAIQPTAPGGPKPKQEIVALSIVGALMAAINAAAVVWWAVSPVRGELLNDLPFAPGQAETWLANMQVAGGMDTLAMISAALWIVVVLRLSVVVWLRILVASACFFGLAIILVAMAISNVTVSQLTAPRPVSFLDDGSVKAHLIIGYTPRSLAALRVEQNAVFVGLRDQPMDVTVVGQQSILDFLGEATPRE